MFVEFQVGKAFETFLSKVASNTETKIDVETLASQLLFNFKNQIDVDSKFGSFLNEHLSIPENIPIISVQQNVPPLEDFTIVQELKEDFKKQKDIFVAVSQMPFF